MSSERIISPTANLIISLGASTSILHGVASRIQRRGGYLLGLSRLIVLGPNGFGEEQQKGASPSLSFVPMEEIEEMKSRAQDGNGELGNTLIKTCQLTIGESPRLKSKLAQMLHDLRVHENLLKLGLGEVQNLPLNIFVVADLTDPVSTGMLYPFLGILQNIMSKEPLGKGHLLLNIAAFPPDQTEDGKRDKTIKAQRYMAMKLLESFLDPHQENLRNWLEDNLPIERIDPLTFPIYLFDYRKEGVFEAKDYSELKDIFGNFLYALLSGGLAHRLGENLSIAEIQDRCAYYSSAAATSADYSPAPLIEACAAHFGEEILSVEMESEGARRQDIEELAQEAISKLQPPRSWLEGFIAGAELEIEGDADSYHVALHFADLNFEDLPEEDWVANIRQYVKNFEQEEIPLYQQKIAENTGTFRIEVITKLEEIIENLPQNPRGYPGGLKTARAVYNNVEMWLETHIHSLANMQSGPKEVTSFEPDLNALERAVQDLHEIPAILAPLVKLLNQFLPLEGLIRWLRYRNVPLIPLRKTCVLNAEHRCAKVLDDLAKTELISLGDELKNRLEKAQETLTDLESCYSSIQENLAEIWETYPPADSIFRVSAVNAPIGTWAYQRWRQPQERIWPALLKEHHFLSGWRTVSAEELKDRIFNYGVHVFTPLRDLTIEDVVSERKDITFTSIIRNLIQGSVPLLRPNFDALGGGSHTHTGQYLFVANPSESKLIEDSQDLLKDWVAVATGDPYTVACMRVRHFIPLNALQEIIREGEKAYENLDKEEREALGFFRELIE